jgi:hypothetical protein
MQSHSIVLSGHSNPRVKIPLHCGSGNSTDEDGVGVGRVNGEALRAASREGELDRPGLARLVKSGEAIAGCGVEARHLS